MSLRDYIPLGPVLSERLAKRWLSESVDEINYINDSNPLSFVVLPFQVFGLRYEEDIVIETTHPDWSMHEYARVRVKGKDVWIAKDSNHEGVQTVTSDLENIHQWVAEAPIPRHSSQVKVVDRSTPDRLDVSIFYKSPKEQSVEVEFSSPRPGAYQRKRNGSTFNHSENSIAAVLNIPRNQMLGVKARVKFDGQEYPIRRVLGIIPVKVLLQQSQAGIAIASMKVSGKGTHDFEVLRPIPGEKWNTQSLEVWKWEGGANLTGVAQYFDQVSFWKYQFREGEFLSAEVSAPGRNLPILNLILSAPLPNLSKRFNGVVSRNFLIKIEGEIHGYGVIKAKSTQEGAVVDFLPQAPYWLASRSMRTTVRVNHAKEVEIRTQRIYL